MKCILKNVLFLCCCLFLVGFTKVNATTFKVGEYVEGEYIRMVGKDITKNLTIQQILENGSYNTTVYCIEPFILVDEEKTDYNIYTKDLSGYKDLSEEVKRKISLIAYYGYGYGNRTTKKWYAITQMLIWKTVDPDSEFYFTDAPNGNEISKYDGSMSEILSDVYYHDLKPQFIKDYDVNYGESVTIKNYDSDYVVVESDFDYLVNSSSSAILIDNVISSGKVVFERENKGIRDVVIFDSKDSQDLIRRGRVINERYTININSLVGNIVLDIKKDKDNIYSLDKDFTNTCYEIFNDSGVVDRVCTGDEDLVYKSESLAYGDYKVRQVSVGKGYVVDNNVYDVALDSSEAKLVLNNQLIKNEIELVKYYCLNDECKYEEGAVFNIYDKNNDLVGIIETDKNGYGSVYVGYGEYSIVQDAGLDNYTFVDVYTESITNNNDKHYKELYNYYLEDSGGQFGTIIPDIGDNDINDSGSLEVLPPQTGTSMAGFYKILYNIIILVSCSCKLKFFCYNN